MTATDPAVEEYYRAIDALVTQVFNRRGCCHHEGVGEDCGCGWELSDDAARWSPERGWGKW